MSVPASRGRRRARTSNEAVARCFRVAVRQSVLTLPLQILDNFWTQGGPGAGTIVEHLTAMFDPRGSLAARRLVWWFIAATLVPAVGTGALGWWIVVQDRALEGQRAQLRRDQAVELAAVALQRTLAELDDRLTSAAASSAEAAKIEPGSVILVFGSQQLVEHAGLPLPFYPALPEPPASDDRFVRADALEFRDRDWAGAIRALEPLNTSSDHALAANALIRVARNEQKLGQSERALQTFDALFALNDVRVDGWPAGLRARQGRALLWAAAGRSDDLRREAAALAEDVRNGRWRIDRPQYQFAMAQVQDWLGDANQPDGADSEQLALARAADAAWYERQLAEQPDSIVRSRQTRWTGDRSVLVLTRSSAHRIAMLLAGPQFLERAWRGPLVRAGSPDVDFALSDADGRPVLGSLAAPLADQSVRTTSATQLPWTVHAIGARRSAGGLGLSGPAQLMLIAVAIMTVVVIAGGYVINRAVAREIAVARLQSDFVTAVSHEFRTPLTTLRHLSELLVQGRVSSEARRRQFYDTLLRESGRLHRLVEGLLNFARLEASELEYQFETIDLHAFLDATIAEVELEVTSTTSIAIHDGRSVHQRPLADG